MNEIGEKLREARESTGISIEEAAEDLKLKQSQIENIEAGNIEAFKDIFSLKYLIRDYSKYLGLDKDKMVDEFNEYLFDYTSKISIEDIKNAKKKNEVKETVKKIKSPYTIERKRKFYLSPALLYAIIFILIGLIIYFVMTIVQIEDDEFIEGSTVAVNN